MPRKYRNRPRGDRQNRTGEGSMSPRDASPAEPPTSPATADDVGVESPTTESPRPAVVLEDEDESASSPAIVVNVVAGKSLEEPSNGTQAEDSASSWTKCHMEAPAGPKNEQPEPPVSKTLSPKRLEDGIATAAQSMELQRTASSPPVPPTPPPTPSVRPDEASPWIRTGLSSPMVPPTPPPTPATQHRRVGQSADDDSISASTGAAQSMQAPPALSLATPIQKHATVVTPTPTPPAKPLVRPSTPPTDAALPTRRFRRDGRSEATEQHLKDEDEAADANPLRPAFDGRRATSAIACDVLVALGVVAFTFQCL